MKEYQLKKIAQAPNHIRNFISLHELPRASSTRIINKYEEIYSEEIEDRINLIIAKYPKPARDKLEKKKILSELEELLGMDQNIQLRLDISDPSAMAQKLADYIGRERIKELIAQLGILVGE